MDGEETEFGQLAVVGEELRLCSMVVGGGLMQGSASADLVPCADLTSSLGKYGDYCWWIARVYVRPNNRGKGLGSLLMAKLIQAVAQREERLVVVAPGGYVEKSGKARQMAFYRQNGFVDVEGEEGLLMRVVERDSMA